MTSEELCVLAKQGDKEAYEQLFKQNMGFCHALLDVYDKPRADR